MAFTIIREDLAKVRADAIVVPANSALSIDGGTALAVANAAGRWRLQRACARLGGCPVGQAVATRGYRLHAAHIIHAVGPVWQGGTQGEPELLRSAYDNALDLALRLNSRSVALPLLSTGAFGYPVRPAFEIAVEAIRAFLDRSDIEAILVVFDKRAVREGSRLFGAIAEFIDDAAAAASSSMRSYSLGNADMWEERDDFSSPMLAPSAASMPREASRYDGASSLGDMLANMDETFSTTLMRLIDARGLTDVQVYKRANITRQHFSKIRKPGYRPTKKTVLALAVALELGLPETRDLLARAGFALSRSSKADIIVEYFIGCGEYDIFAINETLFAYDQPLLG